MTAARWRRPGGFLSLLAVLLAVGVAIPAGVGNAVTGPTDRPGRALIFVIDGISVPEALAVPEVRQLARAGGLGLMTTHVPAGPAGRRQSSYLTIGAGTPLSDQADPRAGLMARALTAPGVATCSEPEAAPLRFIGDGGCLANGLPPASVKVVELPAPAATGSASVRRRTLLADGATVRKAIGDLRNARALVMVVVPMPSEAMDARGDEITPLIQAEGPASSLLPANGEMHALTSASTRRRGLVANTDVAPTALEFFGVRAPADMDGNPIHETGGPAPLSLYDTQLALRRIRVPVQILEAAFIAVAGLIAIGSLLWLRRRSLSPRATAAIRFLILMGVAFPIAILSGGLLPRPSYATVIPYLVLVPAILAFLAIRVRWPGPYPAFGFLGAVGLGFIFLDLLTGAHGLRLPLQGGQMFDGVRFYGLPNLAISPLLASSLLVAAGLSTGWGTGLLVAAGLVAGWPSLGVDVGGSITLFLAAGLWFGIRSAGGKMRPRVLGIAVASTVVGLAVVLAANRFLSPTPTHATRFVQRTTSKSFELFHTIGHRLGVGVHLIASDGAVLIPLIGLFVVFGLVIGRPGPLRQGLMDRRWRNAIGIMMGAAIMSYFVNDTGSTAASPAFLYGMAAIVVPTLAAASGDRVKAKARAGAGRPGAPPKRSGAPATTKPSAKSQPPARRRRRRKR